MKNFSRDNQWLSLCGLNCGLCTMLISGHCPGCGGGAGNQSCAIARCSLEHGKIAYCFQCPAYSCPQYDRIDEYDSFITHQRQKQDLRRAAEMGIEAYSAQQREKAELLREMLTQFDDGRRKSFLCMAVNLLELEDLRQVLREAEGEGLSGLSAKERADAASKKLRSAAERRGVELKLRKKPKK